MHIAIDARIINSSTGRYVERLLHYLEKIDRTNRYTVLVRKKDEAFWVPSNPNFSVKVADFDNYSMAEQTGYLRLLQKLSPDLVHFCMPQQPVLYGGKAITTIHDLTLLNTYNSDKNWFIFHFKQFVGRFVFRHVARKSEVVLVPTEYVKASLLSFAHVPSEKVVVTPEAADISELTPATYQPMVGRDYIMYVGSQSDYKNIKRLIRAHQLLLKTHPDLQLVLVGKTDGKNGLSAARNKAWSEAAGHQNVTFTGFVPDEQLAWLFTHAKAYVFPSLMEGFGLPGLEAMLHGAPVVSSNTTCLPEVYGDAAEYFDPTNESAMAGAIDGVISNPENAETLRKKGYERAKLYSWQRMAEQTHAAYQKVLGL
ncbi:MAG TPA: glycosyltransferase family 1 protein [Candidatus Saccharibacteria bacterium]|nr:glycosyltransferase family 1 protein [Candidatus Saccharibacteria bacterium]HRK93988.1 glycosyltransferase family 1 protein [Candidatus Saccharibacteria bacterium]